MPTGKWAGAEPGFIGLGWWYTPTLSDTPNIAQGGVSVNFCRGLKNKCAGRVVLEQEKMI